MGTGDRYKGGTPRQHSITENAERLKEIFEFANGYFGKRGKSGNSWVRNIASSDPEATSKEFFDTAAFGGKCLPMQNGKGAIYAMSDGTRVIYRPISTSDGSPVTEFNISLSTSHGDIKRQKIHFIKEK